MKTKTSLGSAPNFYPGDRVGLNNEYRDKDSTYLPLIVQTEPYLDGDEWFVLVRVMHEYSWRRTDHEIPCEAIHVIHRSKVRHIFNKVKGFTTAMTRNYKPAIIFGAIAVVVLLLFGLFSGNYNDMVRARNQVDNKFSVIDVFEQKRFDKIGALFNATTGSQIQEQEVFKSIADGRKTYQASGSTDEQKQEASQQVSTAVLQIPKLLQENYPQLASNQNVQKLMTEIGSIESEIAVARRDYNDTATNYNTNIQSFPKNIFAGVFGFKDKQLYKNDAAADKAPNTNANDVLRNKD